MRLSLRKYFNLLLLVVLGIHTPLLAQDNLDIYLAIGQSNMAGRAVVQQDLEAPVDGAYVFTGTDWQPASNPMNIYSSVRKDSSMQRLSPAYGFVRKMKELYPEKHIGMVVNARGGFAIEEWMPGSHFFDEILKRARSASKYGKIRGIIWHQGESNAGAVEQYMAQLDTLVGALRDSLGLPRLAFVAGQLSEDKASRKAFNTMMLELPEKIPYTALVAGFGTATFDSTHFDSPSQILLGERYADKMKTLLDENTSSEHFAFGLITDVQYADAATAGKRNYRGTLTTLEQTIPFLNAYDLSFAVHLGDLIDRDFTSFDRPLAILDKSRAPFHHVWGNHDFSVADSLKQEVGKKLGNEMGYYAFEKGHLVFLVVNGMDISLEGHPEGSENYQKAASLMEELEAAGANNAKPWNGGIGDEQLRWLSQQVKDAEKAGKKVLVFCHYPLLPENGLHLLNSRQVIREVGHSPALVAWFSGHHHEGNYLQDETGLHHLTFQGMVEASSPALGAVVTVYPDKLIIHGIGHEAVRILKFR
ncbi:3',5'-cyclic AMP phosphodiesterase CpdA [Cyclobacterium lianum]|uniref:3',5'-cyclic AMP phosphodiesterase CpdA n=1 Tax=Cyclobacterium lianum TaxID=388280 RepID=A0A1M7Q640_9BACT|nr:sialate O-acetylesterase [Cyclobacterium lianum]SHN25933.1 3',5'-cyclic AMP phosphodiesterase CpdA [Cyclobacterium lianum]